MLQYLGKRFLLMIPTLIGILVISFIIVRLAPGDPTSNKFGGAAAGQAGLNADRGTESSEAKMRKKYKLDEPLHVQFRFFVYRMITGDLQFFGREGSVWDDIIPALKVTILMNGIVFLLVYLLAIPLGVLSASTQGATSDRMITLLLFILYSIPAFWAADMIRLWINDYAPGRLPILGLHSAGAETYSTGRYLADYAWHLVLPVLCQTYGSLAYISRQMRAGMMEVIRQDYIRTARAKGCSETRVLWIHALRNSLFPIITLFAALLPALIGGSVIIEHVFQIPGMGWLTLKYVYEREYDVILATLLMSAGLTLLGILISDILYVLVDPRVTFDGRKV